MSTTGRGHATPIPGTPWLVWRAALLRSAGFGADVVERFAAPDLAAAADAHLDGASDRAGFDAAFDAAAADLGRAVYDVVADPRFREAMAWQNLGALSAPLAILRDGPDAPRNANRRRREELVAKYAQRYAAKNDSIGFFGPMCWVSVDADAPAMTGGHGPSLTRKRKVFFEWWALVALAAAIAADGTDGEVKPWLPVTLQPHLTVRGRTLLAPGRPPRELSGAEAAVLGRCDGRRVAAELAAELAAQPDSGFRKADDVYPMLDRFVEQGVLRWEFVLPMNLSAEDALRTQVRRIEGAAGERARAAVDRVVGARDALAAADGPEAVAKAMEQLNAEFVDVTGRAAHHRDGQTYAGRTVVHLDTARDATYTFGGPVLAALAPLEPLLRSTRWLTSELAAVYRATLERLHQDLAAELGSNDVPFDQLLFVAQTSLFGEDLPANEVVKEFGLRWTRLLGVNDLPDGTECLRITTAELNALVDKEFPAPRPGWPMARLHSPDVHLCAPSEEALARGEFSVVLGELHIGMPALDTDFFRVGVEDEAALAAAMRADVPEGRVHPLVPEEWPRQCARNADWMYGEDDIDLGFTAAPGADPDRLVPVTAITVSKVDGELVVRVPGHRDRPLLDLVSDFLGIHAFDTWKLTGTHGHTPRVMVDDLVLLRRSWRCTVAETGLAAVTGERERYLAARAWAHRLGLPERVFIRVSTEIKPCYIDFTSPVYARVLCNMLRSAGPDAGVTISEMLPTPDQAWLTGHDGKRHTSELRLHIVDAVDAVDSVGPGR
ncbi:lantibiotic dehydratase [Labedaea rhizosphaerae]|uniref:Lantibiotic biosynthesis dehydratase-like protein n=1 Tax=Labedaea rhizosphaerae TaxID=598644 RepID=A0A4R6S8L7_LABRH|nr:lantibiotic dehydratase [Labedaea rhizosphaerae]TDP95216.1 lantibiotic biosynthesis dehydratase-like protein [Labedaea rhizosphaerae]